MLPAQNKKVASRKRRWAVGGDEAGAHADTRRPRQNPFHRISHRFKINLQVKDHTWTQAPSFSVRHAAVLQGRPTVGERRGGRRCEEKERQGPASGRRTLERLHIIGTCRTDRVGPLCSVNIDALCLILSDPDTGAKGTSRLHHDIKGWCSVFVVIVNK